LCHSEAPCAPSSQTTLSFPEGGFAQVSSATVSRSLFSHFLLYTHKQRFNYAQIFRPKFLRTFRRRFFISSGFWMYGLPYTYLIWHRKHRQKNSPNSAILELFTMIACVGGLDKSSDIAYKKNVKNFLDANAKPSLHCFFEK
jgi:hypothetical protein